MIKIIYHGSENIIERPAYGAGKLYNDYGKGFYCTENPAMAKEWCVSRDQDGYANQYEIDCQDFKIIDLNNPRYCILHWLAVLFENREFDAPGGLAMAAQTYLREYFSVDYSDCDVMIGYRADDSCFSFAQDFLDGTISYRQLNRALHLGKLGQQFVLKSERAFERVRFLGYERASCKIWFAKKQMREKMARYGFLDMEHRKQEGGELYITQILEEKMKPDDMRLRYKVETEKKILSKN